MFNTIPQLVKKAIINFPTRSQAVEQVAQDETIIEAHFVNDLFIPTHIDTNVAMIGDLLYNVITGEVGRLIAILDDPFALTDPEPRAYVSSYDPELKSSFTNYLDPGQCVVIERGA